MIEAYIQSGGEQLVVKFITFSDGSETCKIEGLDKIPRGSFLSVNIKPQDCNKDLIRICLIKDAIDRVKGAFRVTLNLDYMLQARADRVFENTMPLPVKVFADIINSCKFDDVIVKDPHSDVTSALLDKVTVIPQHHVLKQHLTQIKRSMPEFKLCAPDIGSARKIFDSVQMLGHEDYIQAVKIRDVKTGDIIKCDIDMSGPEIKGDVLIVDDISDYGNSFKFLAQKLKEKGAKRVGLFVTHGIFAGGLKALEKDIDFIWCDGSIGSYINQEDLRKYNEC